MKAEGRRPRPSELTASPKRSAELHFAVSQIWNLRRGAKGQRVGPVQHPAEYNSAVRQIENLRYEASRPPQIRQRPDRSSGVRRSSVPRKPQFGLRILCLCQI